MERGIDNLAAHIDAASHYKKPILVAINQRGEDTDEELNVIHKFCSSRSVPCSTANVFAHGGAGAVDLADQVVAAVANSKAGKLQPLYPLEMPLEQKIETIATKIYGARSVVFTAEAASKFQKAARLGYGNLPVCMAKTQNSLSDNPKLLGRPKDFTITVRDMEISAGAGFVVALTGDIVRMPGLPERPAAERIDVDDSGKIINLF